MALYTIFAWTAIVIAGGAYYWIYIRQAPLPAHLLGLSSKLHSRESTAEGIVLAAQTKRKRKTVPNKKRPVVAQTNELIAGTNGVSGDESDEGAAKLQVQDERGGVVEPKSLKVDTEPPRKQVKRETHFTPSDADESDALDTPTPAPTKKQPTSLPFDSLSAHTKNAAETRFEKVTPKTSVDDMIPQEDRPAVARVMRISSPSNESITPSTPRPANPREDSTGSGLAIDKDGLTKKQRQNQKKKERHREAKAREEAIRQSQLRAHQKELETIRLNSQIKAAEKKSSTNPINAWQQSGRPNVDQPPSAMDESVYTIRNLSEENLTTLGHRSDGAASEEGWQEVTSKAVKKAAAAASSSQKAASGTEGSEEVSSSLGDSEEGSVLKVRPAYVSSNSFANLDS